jgi:hypothetical protein
VTAYATVVKHFASLFPNLPRPKEVVQHRKFAKHIVSISSRIFDRSVKGKVHVSIAERWR